MSEADREYLLDLREGGWSFGEAYALIYENNLRHCIEAFTLWHRAEQGTP